MGATPRRVAQDPLYDGRRGQIPQKKGKEGREELKETRDTTRSKKKRDEGKMNQNIDLAQASIAESQ